MSRKPGTFSHSLSPKLGNYLVSKEVCHSVNQSVHKLPQVES